MFPNIKGLFIFLDVIVIPAKINQMLLEDALYRNEMLTNHILASVDNISVVCCIIVTLLAKSNTPNKGMVAPVAQCSKQKRS